MPPDKPIEQSCVERSSTVESPQASRSWIDSRPAQSLRVILVVAVAALLAACAGSTPVEDNTSWYINNERVPDSEWQKTDGPFGAQLFITEKAEAEAVYDFWENEEGGVPIRDIDSAEPGTAIETIVFFIRCAADSSGNCLVRGFVTVTTSAGQVLMQDHELLLSEKPPPEGYTLGISEAGAGLKVGESDGAYLFEMRVVDSVAKREVTLRRRVAVDR